MRPLITSSKILEMYKSRSAGLKSIELNNDLFPIYPNACLAGIVGDLFSDGHLQGPPKWRLDFTSSSKSELKRFEKELYLQFRFKGKIRACTTNKYGITYNYGVNNKLIAITLFLCGVPAGNKVMQPTKIPDWILKNDIMFKRFIQRVFDCEGCVDTKNKYIELQMWKSEALMENGFDFFNSIKSKLFEFYQIETTNSFTDKRSNMRKDGTKTKALRIKIKRKDAVINFYKKIGFENKGKMRKLRSVISEWEGN